mgnify:CR=1 FL=1
MSAPQFGQRVAEGDAAIRAVVNLDHLDWHTSTFSGENGASCVEVAPIPAGAAWRTTAST